MGLKKKLKKLGKVFVDIVEVAAPLIGGAIGGPVGFAIGTAISGAIGSREQKKASKRNQAIAQLSADEQKRLLEEQMKRADEFVKEQQARATEMKARIDQDMNDAIAQLEGAKQSGDAEAEALFASRIEQLQGSLDQETAKAEQLETDVAERFAIPRELARSAVAGEIKTEADIKEQVKGLTKGALKTEKEAREFETGIIREAIPRSLRDIEQGLGAARTEQDAAFRTEIQEAEREAAKRGEDPRRASLNIKIQQAKARGQLTATQLRERAVARVNIAKQASLPGGRAEADIAGRLLETIPRDTSRLAELELEFAGKDISRADIAAAKGETRRRERLFGGLEAEKDVRTARTAGTSALARDVITQRQLGTKGIRDVESGLATSELAGLREGGSVLKEGARVAGVASSDALSLSAKQSADSAEKLEGAISAITPVVKKFAKKGIDAFKKRKRQEHREASGATSTESGVKGKRSKHLKHKE